MTNKGLLKKSVICKLFASAVAIAAGISLREDEPDPWTIELSGPITEELADDIINELSIINEQNPRSPIFIYFHSTGGSVIHGNEIIEALRNLSNPVYAICDGDAASMAFIIFTSGNFIERTVTQNCKGIFHFSRMTFDYTPEKINQGAPSDGTHITLENYLALKQKIDQDGLEKITYTDRGWNLTFNRRTIETDISNLVKTRENFINLVSDSSRLTSDDIKNFSGIDVYFTPLQMLWAGLADRHAGYVSFYDMAIAADDFCDHHPVSICE